MVAIAARAGVGLKPAHHRAVLDTRPDLGFFEIHAENYMGDGGPPHRLLEAVRASYPLSIHGVGLSIGSSDELDREHLERLRRVVSRYEPSLVSEHLAWSRHNGVFLNDLLPIAYTRNTLMRVCAHIDEVQSALSRTILLENPSTYVRFAHDTLAETEFLSEVAARTGCGLLLDVNNVMVCAVNHGTSPHAYIDAFPIEAVEEIHLAGFKEERGRGEHRLLIDDHGSAVHDEVWSLYEYALRRTGAMPTLVEWDNNIPEWPELLQQAQRAEIVLRHHSSPLRIGMSIHAAFMG
jgi:uncharacterized protein (UPF0276 family)